MQPRFGGERAYAGLCQSRCLLLLCTSQRVDSANELARFVDWGSLGTRHDSQTDRWDVTAVVETEPGPDRHGNPSRRAFIRLAGIMKAHQHIIYSTKNKSIGLVLPSLHNWPRDGPIPTREGSPRKVGRCASLERCCILPNLMYARRPGAIVHMPMDLKERWDAGPVEIGVVGTPFFLRP